MSEIHRVFFHEIGHFISHEIVLQYYSGTGTKSIIIHPWPSKNEIFVGDAKIHLSSDEREKRPPTIDRLALYLATSTYGCIFQSYYKGESILEHCFKHNGEDDAQKWNASLRAHGIDDYKSEFSKAESEYYNFLIASRSLEPLITLEPEKYLINLGDNNFTINIETLKKDTQDFVLHHKESFAKLLQAYKEIIDKYVK